MSALRTWLASLGTFAAAAVGCNGLLGIDDGAYDNDIDSGVSINQTETGADGSSSGDGSVSDSATDAPKTDAGNDLLAHDLAGILSLVQDDDNLYWISTGNIMTMPKSGASAPRTIVGIVGATVVAVDPGSASTGNVYVATANKITSHPKGTGSPADIVTLASGRTAVAIGSDGMSLLFIDFREMPEEAVVKRVAKTGGTAVSITGSATTVTALGVSPTWAAYIDETNVTRRIFEVDPPTGGAPTSHATTAGSAIYGDVRSLTMDANAIYWLDSTQTSTFALRSQAKGSATSEDIATFSNSEEPSLVVVDASKAGYVLLTTATTGSNFIGDVVKVQKGSTTRTTIVSKLDNPTGLVTSGGYLYVAEDRPFTKADIQKIKLP